VHWVHNFQGVNSPPATVAMLLMKYLQYRFRIGPVRNGCLSYFQATAHRLSGNEKGVIVIPFRDVVNMVRSGLTD